MINLLLTRRQLFLLVLGTPLATVLLFVLGVFSGAAIGAPGPVVTAADEPATENTDPLSESASTRSLRLDASEALSTRAPDRVARTPFPLLSPAQHSVRVERGHRETSLSENTPTTPDEPSDDALAAEPLFSIQAGVFAELDNARKLDRHLKARGLSSRLEVVDGPEAASERYRVRVGLFRSRAAAMAALEEQDGDLLADAFIVSRPLSRS